MYVVGRSQVVKDVEVVKGTCVPVVLVNIQLLNNKQVHYVRCGLYLSTWQESLAQALCC